jgi:hypothetical protein
MARAVEARILLDYSICYNGWILFDKTISEYEYEETYTDLYGGNYWGGHIAPFLRIYISHSEDVIITRLRERKKDTNTIIGRGWPDLTPKIDYLAITAEICGASR